MVGLINMNTFTSRGVDFQSFIVNILELKKPKDK